MERGEKKSDGERKRVRKKRREGHREKENKGVGEVKSSQARPLS